MNFPIFSAAIQGDQHVFADGSVVISGLHTLNDPENGLAGHYNFVWFTNTGHLDQTKVHRKGSGAIYMVKQLANGRFLCSGPVTVQEGQPVNRVFRLHADGSLDNSFNAPIQWGEARNATELPDGRVIVSGIFKSSAVSTDTLHILRLLPDGQVDPTFNNELEAWWPFMGQRVTVMHTILPDGRIVLHGAFTTLEGEIRNGISIVDPNGQLLDDAFTGEGCGTFIFNNFPYGGTTGIVEGHDGMWYIYGSYIGYDGNEQQRFVSRLHPPGPPTAMDRAAIETKGELKLSPNPANAWVAVDHELAVRNGLVALWDALGRVVHTEKLGDQRHVVDLQHLPDGIYMVGITDGTNAPLPAQRLVVRREQ
jgi:hypothetical protein